jgi:CysZ protein
MFPLLKTIQSIKKAGLIPLMIMNAVLAILTVLILASFVTWITSYVATFEQEWLNKSITIGAGLLTGIAGWFMLPSLIIIIGGIFQDTIIKKVEKFYYPHFTDKKVPSSWPDLVHDIKFTLKALLLNILILPLYLFGVGFAASVIMNSYLLGREFFESVAGSHLGKKQAATLFYQKKIFIYSNGLLITLLSLVPIINVFMPVIALVHMIHIFHYINSKED